MKITNLRPKNGAVFELDQNGHLTIRTPLGVIIGETIEQSAVEGCFDYDVIPPEYKTGDLVAVEVRGIKRKGFIYDEDDEYWRIAVQDSDEYPISKCSLSDGDKGWKLVGLWLEGEE